jgi:uncharacterized protein (TIGR00730 family)
MTMNLTVYCSSSKKVAPVYFQAAESLGRGIGRRGWGLVYGGNHVGLMAALADGARAEGAKVIGVTPQLLVDKGIADNACDELIITADMRQRKALMEERGDAFVVLPGGIGTFEEAFEILAGRSLGFHNKPIVLLNVDNYYGPLLDMLQHGLRKMFIREDTLALLFVADSVELTLDYLQKQVPPPPAPAEPSAGTINSAIE